METKLQRFTAYIYLMQRLITRRFKRQRRRVEARPTHIDPYHAIVLNIEHQRATGGFHMDFMLVG